MMYNRIVFLLFVMLLQGQRLYGQDDTVLAPPPKLKLSDQAHSYEGQIYKYLQKIPMWADEDFLNYLLRVRWTMRHGEDPALGPAIEAIEAIRDRLRGDTKAWAPLTYELAPILLGRWAASFRRAERLALLRKTNRLALNGEPIIGLPPYAERLTVFDEDLNWVAGQTHLKVEKVSTKQMGGRIRFQSKRPRKRSEYDSEHLQIWSIPRVDRHEGDAESAFGGLAQNRRLYGHGIVQQHAPFYAVFYALAALADSGLSFRRSPELIWAESQDALSNMFSAMQGAENLGKTQVFFGSNFPYGVSEERSHRISFSGDVIERSLQLHGNVIWEDAPVGADEARLTAIENISRDNQPDIIQATLHPESQARGDVLVQRFNQIVKLKNEVELDWTIKAKPNGDLEVSVSGHDRLTALNGLIRLLSDFATLSPGPCTGVLHALKNFRLYMGQQTGLSGTQWLVERLDAEGLDGCRADIVFDLPKKAKYQRIRQMIESWYTGFGEEHPQNNMRFTISNLNNLKEHPETARKMLPGFKRAYEYISDNIFNAGVAPPNELSRLAKDAVFWGPFDSTLTRDRLKERMPYISEYEFDRLVTIYMAALAGWSL